MEQHPRSIAASLSIGQRLAIRDLDRQFAPLSCAANVAKRLERRSPKRPALAISRPGDGGREFALNDIGMAVKEVLW
ncbi:hypothetical protein BW41_00080 [Sphingomonas sp. RIT328]|nr:hypothetical protein BW41_00080 [Sphingomonas sp. RIT328]